MSHITESRRGTVYCQGMCSVTCNGLQRSVGAPHSESVASAHLVSILNSLVHRAVPVELSTVRRSAVTPCPSTELRGAARRWRLGDRTVDDDVVSRLSAVPIYSILARHACGVSGPLRGYRAYLHNDNNNIFMNILSRSSSKFRDHGNRTLNV